MIFNCPICGKLTCAHWPQHWVYRRGPTYYCSDPCMYVDIVRDLKLMNEVKKRRKEAKAMNGKITLEMKKKAVEIAINGESPLPYLKRCGAKNPSASWQYIKQTLQKKDPETFAKLPEKLPASDRTAEKAEEQIPIRDGGTYSSVNMAETPEDGFTEAEIEQIKQGFIPPVTQPEKRPKPGKKIDYEVAAIRVPNLGEFYFDRKFNSVDWRTAGGDEVSLGPAWWLDLMEQLPQILKVLGVDTNV